MNYLLLPRDHSPRITAKREVPKPLEPSAEKTQVVEMDQKPQAHSFRHGNRCSDIQKLIDCKRFILKDESLRVLLALCDKPFSSQTSLCEYANIAKGNGSITISELIQIGLVKSEKGLGKRKTISLAGPPETIRKVFGLLLDLYDGNKETQKYTCGCSEFKEHTIKSGS